MPTNTDVLIDQLLAAQLRPGDRVFASGEAANNHLDLGYEETTPELRPTIVHDLAELIVDTVGVPAFIAPVPTGAVGWGKQVSGLLTPTPELIVLDKVAPREFKPTSELRSQIRKLRNRRGVVIDDATSDGGTSAAYAECIEKLGLEVSLVVSIFFRGQEYAKNRFQRLHLFARPIPYQLNWQKFLDECELVEVRAISVA